MGKLQPEQINQSLPEWQHPVLPGQALQGSILLTTTDFKEPPQSQSNFIWVLMDDLIGVANIKLEYVESENRFLLYKAKGHLTDDGEWTYKWEPVGQWEGITTEVEEALKSLKYVEYRFDDTEPNTLNVIGVLKDGTTEQLLDLSFVSKEEFDSTIANLTTFSEGDGIKFTETTAPDKVISIRYNADDFEIDNNGDLKLKIIDDTSRASNKTWSAYQIDKLTENGFQFRGTVYDKTLLPSNPTIGSVYGVNNEADLYVYLGNDTWKAFTEIDETGYPDVIVLRKSISGLIAYLRYDTNDFKTDGGILRSNLINDNLTESDINTYSINKINQLRTSIMRYKGQVSTYNNLPTTGQEVGDCYNVEDTGDNYAWNGTSWDKLSGEYTEGTGIAINGKVVSTKIGNGLNYDTNNAIKVKGGSGIDVNANGVNVKTGKSTELVSGNIEVKPEPNAGLSINPNGVRVLVGSGILHGTGGQLEVNPGDGLTIDGQKVAINANFVQKSTPLGTENSKLAIYSDGKIAVDFEENPVVLSGELLVELVATADSQQVFNNVNVPNMDVYDMFRFEYGITNLDTGTYSMAAGEYLQKSPTVVGNMSIRVFGPASGDSTAGYAGITFHITNFETINFKAGTIGKISRWIYQAVTYPGQTELWVKPSTVHNRRLTIRIYGMKAK